MTSVICSPPSLSYSSAYMDRSYSRDSNSAGAPLPRIPRRMQPSRSQSSNAPSTTLQNLFATPPAKLIVQPPTPPSKSPSPLSKPPIRQIDDDASSSSGSESYVEILGSKSRRSRRHQPYVCPPEYSTPTPAVFQAKSKEQQGVVWPSRGEPASPRGQEETPRASFSRRPDVGRLRLILDDDKRASSSTATIVAASPVPESAASTSSSRSVSITLGRKKSGEPLKSSLKSRRPVVRGDLSVITGAMSSKSEPSTPTHIKSVHFDAQLEHIKLFLAEQKPLAVSRDGSPTDDTSGTDSDFPSFIFGHSDEERIRKALTVDVVNLPPQVPADADIALESLILSEDGSCITGSVQVRNIAFEKWVAVRFTFDWWQTTSEVTAKYVESVPGGKVDRFAFSIRLNDMLKRIEEKTLFLALRYSVGDREIWDNNGGDNYQVKFKVQAPKPLPSPMMTSSVSAPAPLDSTGSPSRMADLKSKLEQVAKGREASGREATVGGMLTQEARRSPTKLGDDDSNTFTLNSDTPLSSRYDFSSSLRSPWKAGSPLSSEERPRTNTYPNAMPWFPQRRAFHEKKFIASDPRSLTRGSPRIADEGDKSPPLQFYAGSDLDDTPVPALSRRRSRNHQRGYFDIGIPQTASSVRRTPPGTPRGDSLRFNSFPPSDGQSYVSSPPNDSSFGGSTETLVPAWFRQGGSEESTPSITSTSDTSESSQDSSPMESPISSPAYYPGSPTSSNYNVFLSKFCFYTGPDSMLGVPVEQLQRSHSASSVEELLSSPTASGTYSFASSHTPTRSSSFDDVAIASGLSTPTMHGSAFGSPPSAHMTPVAFVH